MVIDLPERAVWLALIAGVVAALIPWWYVKRALTVSRRTVREQAELA